MKIDSGFPPIVGLMPKVLILGTLPSQRSLAAQQYYGNPQNAFWWIMGQLYHFDVELSYEQKTEALRKADVAVWDVIRSCLRPGSMDADIDEGTLRPNDFVSFLDSKPSIELIVFNGQAADKLFRKHVVLDRDIRYLTMPSTSPAYASMQREQKLSKWRVITN